MMPAAMDHSIIQITGLGLLSLAMSVVAGMTGAAMGIVQLPVMLALGFDPLIAAGTNLGVILLASISGMWPHIRAGRVVPRIIVIFGLPTVVGTFAGAMSARLVPTWILLSIVTLVLVVLTGITFRDAWKRVRPPLRPVRHRLIFQRNDPRGSAYLRPRAFLIDGGASAAIGAVGGAAGMTLGALRLPILVSFLKMDPWYAAGTNAGISLLTALAGFAGHAVARNFDVPLLVVMGVAGMAGGAIGATLTGRVRPTLLRFLIGAVLVIMIPLVVYRAVLAY
jgi:uncharacterized membrane protein YfcA